MANKEMDKFLNDLYAGKLEMVSATEIEKRISSDEKIMKRINRAKTGEKEMTGTNLVVTASRIREYFSFKELQVIEHIHGDVEEYIEESVKNIIGGKKL